MKTLLKFLKTIRAKCHADIYAKIDNAVLKIENSINCSISEIDFSINRSIDRFNEQFSKVIKKITPDNTLTHFEIHLTDHCNLNCWGCSHFSTLADETYLSLDSFANDMKRISELSSGNIVSINLQGGEPLLHPDLIKFFEISRLYFKKTIIRLITNGLLLNSMQESFWLSLKNNNIILAPTKYPINVPWDSIEQIAAKYGVNMYYYNSGYNSGKGDYKKHMICSHINIEGKHYPSDNPFDTYLNCYQGNRCIQLRNGRLYTCAIAAYAEYFSKYFNLNLSVSDADSIDIYKATCIQEILDFLARPIPFCRYCSVVREPNEHIWQISERKMAEWTGTNN